MLIFKWSIMGWLLVAPCAAGIDNASPSQHVFIRNNLDFETYAWIDDLPVGSVPARSTRRWTTESPPSSDTRDLTMIAIGNHDELLYGTITLDATRNAVDCWFGGVRGPLEHEKKRAEVLGPLDPPEGAWQRFQEVVKSNNGPSINTDGDRDVRMRRTSRVIIGSDYPKREIIENSIGMRLVQSFPGEFLMGCTPAEPGCTAPELQHLVRITNEFFIGETEVTQAQWIAVMGNNPSHFAGDDLPVESITWHDAVEFCRRLSKREGRTYRLPTEAEWEYCCRAGTVTAYSWGDSASQIDRYAWTNRNSNQATHPVASKLPNSWGLYDMHGNVLEWCSDWWSWRYPRSMQINPQGPDTGSQKVIRGGRWNYNPIWTRSAARDCRQPIYRYDDLGLRVVLQNQETPDK